MIEGRLASACEVLQKARRAKGQTDGGSGRKRTIISVDYDEAAVIEESVKRYLENWKPDNEWEER